MADQRTGGNAGQSPAEAGAQVRDRAQEASAQVRDKAQAMVRQGVETASDSYQQGRQQVEAVQHTLEDAIRAKPWQAIRFCQVVEAETLIRQAGASPRSSPPVRRRAPYR